MSDLDLERLGDVWRQRPDPAELEELRRTAEAVRRRALWGQIIDLVAALVVAGVVLLLAMRNPRIETLLIGGSAVLVLLWSHVRQRRMRQIEVRGLTVNTEEMLDQSIARVEATLRRTRFQLIGFVPAFLLGLAFAYAADAPRVSEELARISADSSLHLLVLAVAAVSLAGMGFHLVRVLRRSREEVHRLKSLRDAYDEERKSSLAE
jgi:hypothetical protein